MRIRMERNVFPHPSLGIPIPFQGLNIITRFLLLFQVGLTKTDQDLLLLRSAHARLTVC